MSNRFTYDDRFTGKADDNIREILGEKQNESDMKPIKKILYAVIENELTDKQKNVVMLYYFKNMSSTEIASKLSVTPQAVLRTLSRARVKIYSILKYYMMFRG